MLSDCEITNWNDEIKKQTIHLKRKYNIKLPDAIIVATAIFHDIPLVSADKQLSKITELDFILIEP